MINKFRIENEELLDENHFAVKALFDMVSDKRFIKVIEGLSNGMGFGENYGTCVFWNDLDDYDKENMNRYDGAEFGLNNGEEIIIGYQDLFYYLTLVCDKYCKEFLKDKEKIRYMLENYKIKYGINFFCQYCTQSIKEGRRINKDSSKACKEAGRLKGRKTFG